MTTRADILRREAARMLELAAKVDVPKPDAEVVWFDLKFAEGGRLYDFAAVKVRQSGTWWISGERGLNGRRSFKTWGDLVEAIIEIDVRDNAPHFHVPLAMVDWPMNEDQKEFVKDLNTTADRYGLAINTEMFDLSLERFRSAVNELPDSPLRKDLKSLVTAWEARELREQLTSAPTEGLSSIEDIVRYLLG